MAGLTRVTGGGITDGTITNADINASAAIDASKVSGLSTDSITEGNTTVEVVDTGSNGHITFDTEGTEKARFDTTGRLLVGHTSTTTPGGFSHQVQIHGTDQDTSSLSLISNAGANVHEAATITFGKTRGTSAGAANAISSGDTIGTIQFAAADNTDVASVAAAIRCSADGAVSGNDTPGRLVFQTTADGSSTPTERMRITNGGNVGIGTDSPMTDCQLTLGQSTAPKLGFSRTSTGGGGAFDGAIELNSDGHFAFRNGSNSTTASGLTERMRITNGGNVGIGTSAPNVPLHVKTASGTVRAKIGSGDSNAAALYLQNSTTGDGDSDGFKLELGGDEEAYIWMHENADMNFGTNNVSRAVIQAGGNVGIGTDAPATRLAVHSGQAELQLKSTSGTNSAGFRMIPGGQTNAVYMYTDGNRNVNFDDHATAMISIRANGGGITFHGDTAAANALDDYEEGTWTPSWINGATVTSYTTQSGRYTKIGRIVYFECVVHAAAGSVAAAHLRMGGLPFNAGSGPPYGGAYVVYTTIVDDVNNAHGHVPYVLSVNGTDDLYFYRRDGQFWNANDGIGTVIGKEVRLNGFYVAA